jgi:hypothetical protein
VPPDRRDELEPDLVRELDVVRERELVFEPLPDFERVVEPVLRDSGVRDVPSLDLPDSPPSSSESPFEPRSFFPTPTAAAVARPTAAPVATFFGVDIPSFPSSSDAMVNPPSPR